ncbi:MAG: hypothetical protein R2799_14100 [Crocinitomicaceae bacterium]
MVNRKTLNIVLKVIAIFLVAVLVKLGFYREDFFVEMNKLIGFKENPEVGNWASEIVADYYDLTAAELYEVKWKMTIYFSIYFYLLSALILFLFFRERKPLLYLLFFYLGIFILSAISYGSGFVTGNKEGAYLVARRLMGLLQSPYPFMLIFVLVLFKLDKMQVKMKE